VTLEILTVKYLYTTFIHLVTYNKRIFYSHEDR